MKLVFRHIEGYSGVDHFGGEIVSLCEQIAAERPKPEGLTHDCDRISGDYRKMIDHGRSIVRDAIGRFRPCADYSGPSYSSVRVRVGVASPGHGNLVPPLVWEDGLSALGEYIKEYKKVPIRDSVEWRERWVQSHPECRLGG